MGGLREGAEIVVRVEDRFGIEVSDESVGVLPDAKTLHHFIVDATKAKGCEVSGDLIWAELQTFVVEVFNNSVLAPETDILGGFRRALRPRLGQ